MKYCHGMVEEDKFKRMDLLGGRFIHDVQRDFKDLYPAYNTLTD